MADYRITSKDFSIGTGEPDCIIDKDDPMLQMAYLGGLGGRHRIAELKLKQIHNTLKDKDASLRTKI